MARVRYARSPRESEDAHRANGMVRIDAHDGDRVVFQTSFDGEATYDLSLASAGVLSFTADPDPAPQP